MKNQNTIFVSDYKTPCGDLLIGSTGDALCLCNWRGHLHPGRIDARLRHIFQAEFRFKSDGIIEETARQLDEYFSGGRTEFQIPIILAGTEFQKRVWSELLSIPYGTSVSYGELAIRVGKPSAVRAVANANGANAISVIVPCHRVVGVNSTLGGYGGGLSAKRFLLDLENVCGVWPE